MQSVYTNVRTKLTIGVFNKVVNLISEETKSLVNQEISVKIRRPGARVKYQIKDEVKLLLMETSQ